jgi:hypothetical protein
MSDLSYVPETLQNAAVEVDENLLKLLNLLNISNCAAQWEKEHDSGEDDGLCWSWFLQGSVKEAMDRLSVSTSDFKKTIFSLVSKTSNQELSNQCSALVNELSKVQDLLSVYEVTAESEEDSGHDNRVNWPALFSIVLDVVTRIRAINEDLWNKTTESIRSEAVVKAESAKRS